LSGIGQIYAHKSDNEESFVPAKERFFNIKLNLGFTISGYREETVFDINRYHNAFIFNIGGNIENKSFLHSFNLGFFSSKDEAILAYPIESITDPIFFYYLYYQKEYSFTRFFFEYALDYRLWGSKTFPGYLGGAIRSDVYFTGTLNNILYLNFSGIISLNLHASQKWIINDKNSFVFSISCPITGYAIRPSYTGFISYPLETGITSLHNYRAVFGELNYYHKFNTSISLNSGIGFELSQIDFPRPRKDAAFRLNLGIALNF